MDLTDNVIEEVQQKEGLITSFLDTLPEKVLNLGIRIGLALIFFFIGVQLIKLIRKIIRKSMNRAGAEMGVIQFVDSFVKASLYIILILPWHPPSALMLPVSWHFLAQPEWQWDWQCREVCLIWRAVC